MAACTAELAVEDRVAVVTLLHPPVNALHPDLLASLVVQLARAQASSEADAVVLAGSSACFCAGFDITLFRDPRAVSSLLRDQRPALLAALIQLVEAGPKPTVAALHGATLGGGLELAMACNARLAAGGAALGLPESRLGILPGFGGTQRLPRLVGVSVAAALMRSGKALAAQEAEAVGLVDGVVDAPDALLAAARRLALELAAGSCPRRQTLRLGDRLGSPAAALAAARAEAVRRHPGQRHQQLLLDAMQAGIEQGPERGFEVEGRAFAQAAALPLHRALVRAFFAYRAAVRARAGGGGLLRWAALAAQLAALAALAAVVLLRLWAWLTAKLPKSVGTASRKSD